MSEHGPSRAKLGLQRQRRAGFFESTNPRGVLFVEVPPLGLAPFVCAVACCGSGHWDDELATTVG